MYVLYVDIYKIENCISLKFDLNEPTLQNYPGLVNIR